jgi:hypothetical protein
VRRLPARPDGVWLKRAGNTQTLLGKGTCHAHALIRVPHSPIFECPISDALVKEISGVAARHHPSPSSAARPRRARWQMVRNYDRGS